MTRLQSVLLALVLLIVLAGAVLGRSLSKKPRVAPRGTHWIVTIGDPVLLPGQNLDEEPRLVSPRRFVVPVP